MCQEYTGYLAEGDCESNSREIDVEEYKSDYYSDNKRIYYFVQESREDDRDIVVG